MPLLEADKKTMNLNSFLYQEYNYALAYTESLCVYPVHLNVAASHNQLM